MILAGWMARPWRGGPLLGRAAVVKTAMRPWIVTARSVAIGSGKDHDRTASFG